MTKLLITLLYLVVKDSHRVVEMETAKPTLESCFHHRGKRQEKTEGEREVFRNVTRNIIIGLNQ